MDSVFFLPKTWIMQSIKVRIILPCILLLASSYAFCQNNLIGNGSVKSNSKLAAYRKSIYENPPVPDGYVNDYENIFSPSESASLDSLIRDFHARTGFEIAFVSFDTSMTVLDSLESLSLRMANRWGVGQKDKDNGVIVGMSSGYGTVKILYGTGIDNLISNDETNKIIREKFIPYYEKDQYYKGTYTGLQALMKLLASKYKP